MDALEQSQMCAALERGFAEAGVEILAARHAGGNVSGFSPVPWEAVLGQLLRRQWVVRMPGLQVEGRVLLKPGRADIHQAVRILEFPRRPFVEPDVQSHAPEGTADDHGDVTDG